MDVDPTFAAASRQRCAPLECDGREGCWVATGKPQGHNNNRRTFICDACSGRVRAELWVPPSNFRVAADIRGKNK